MTYQLLLLFFIQLGLQCIRNDFLFTIAYSDFDIMQDHVQQDYLNGTNIMRLQYVTSILETAKGVYIDKIKSQQYGLEDTVMSTVISFNRHTNYHYKIFFLNFLCYCHNYGYNLVVYVIHHNVPNIHEEMQWLKSLGVHPILYPDELFWLLIKTKKQHYTGKNHADYSGDYPNFVNFGALPMLVPTLEMLYLGYNVIYFDIDQAFIFDPVPYLIKGNADYVTTLELRECPEIYPSILKNTTNWKIEPNTGVLHVRATSQGIEFYRAWLDNIVQLNAVNDQTVFDHNYKNAEYTGNCNWDIDNINETKKSSVPTYCFLSEILFQNGKIGIVCPTKGGSREDWLLAMKEGGVIDETFPNKYFPISLHVNYCNAKTHELEVRGLWLLNDHLNSPGNIHNITKSDMCKVFNRSHIYYSQLDWQSELEEIQRKRNILRSNVLMNGSLIRGIHESAVYLINEHNQRRIIPDGITFEKLQLDWSKITPIPSSILYSIVEGEPIPVIH